MEAMRLELTDMRGEYQGWVEWDPATGALEGPLAAAIQQSAQWALESGSIDCGPPPNSIDAVDPLRNLPEFAALLANSYVLPPELADHYPHPVDEWDDADLPPGLVF